MSLTTLALDDKLQPINQLITGIEAVRIAVIEQLRFLLGEWFLDRTAGIPYYGLREQDLPLLDQAIQAAALSVRGVLSVSEYTGVLRHRQYTVRMVLGTDEALIPQIVVFSGELPKQYWTADSFGRYWTASIINSEFWSAS